MSYKNTERDVSEADHRERVWKWERAGWILMALFLTAGLANALNPSFRSKHLGRKIPSATSAVPYAANRLHTAPKADAGSEPLVRVNLAYFAEISLRPLE
ncbi:MAG TPA: hypothetical protein VMZ27_03835 [Candidatus Saccharimonadales bacterium]|nr:hypothetical protein [Candidatus Saccharimonadales bacterium]